MKNILLIITNPIEFFKKNSKKKFLKYGISIWLLNTFWLITNYILLKLDLINYKLIFLDINNLVSLIVSIVLSLFAIIIIVVITNSIVILFKGKNKFINLLVAHLLIGIISILFIPLNIIFYFLKSSLLLRISNYIVGIWQIILSFCAIIGVYFLVVG